MSYDLDQNTRIVNVVDEMAGVSSKFKIIIPSQAQRLRYRNKLMSCTNAKGMIDLEKLSDYNKKIAPIVIVGLLPPTKKADGSYSDDGYLTGGQPLSSCPDDPGYQSDWLERIMAKRWPIVVALINEVFEEHTRVTNAEQDPQPETAETAELPGDDALAEAADSDPL